MMTTRQTYPLLLATTLAMVASSPRAVKAAEAFRIAESTQSAIPVSKESDGMINDWLIRNDRVVAIIGDTAPGRDANQMVEGVQGAVLDFTYRDRPNDGLVIFYTMGYRPTGVSADRAEVTRSGGEIAELVTVREATAEEPYTSTTTYRLRDGESALRVTTVHENSSSTEVEVPVRDWLRMDNDVESQQSDRETPVAVLDNQWFQIAYGLASTDGRTRKRAFETKGFRAKGVLVEYPSVSDDGQETVNLAPGERVELDRWLILGADTAAVQRKADQLLGQKSPVVTLQAQHADGSAIEGAYVEAKQDDAVVSAGHTDSSGSLDLRLPDGRYDVTASQIGRKTVQQALEVRNGKIAAGSAIQMEPQAMIALDIAEAGTGRRMPVKVELRSQNGEEPFLGPRKRANGSGNLFYSLDGTESFPAPAGEYTAHITRGPEHGLETRSITVAPGRAARISARLERAFQTPGWITADLHNHSTGSGDSATPIASRVLNLAGSGIEFGLATEHNRIATYTPTIESLGLQEFIASSSGIELSGRPGPGQINHQTAFPLIIRQNQQGYGAPPTDADPAVQMQRLYDLDQRSPKLMQHNHPDIAWLYFDKNRDGALDDGFGTRAITDVMEIRDSMYSLLPDTSPGRESPSSRAFHWLQMLNQGDRIYGTANSDAHAVGHDNGALFNYIAVPDDNPATLYPWDVARAVQNGHVVMSNGPFLAVRIGDSIPGDSLSVPSGKVTIDVTVDQASWSRIDRVQVLVNGRQLPSANYTRAEHPALFADAPRQFEHQIELHLDGDAHIIIAATGESADMNSVRSGRHGRHPPLAISNPIFIDVDGGGFDPSKDLLGRPLPTALPDNHHGEADE